MFEFKYNPKVQPLVDSWYDYMDKNHGSKTGNQSDSGFTTSFIEKDHNPELRRFIDNWVSEVLKLNDEEYQETVAKTYAFVEDNLNDEMGSDAAYSNGLALLYEQCLDNLKLYTQVSYEINPRRSETDT